MSVSPFAVNDLQLGKSVRRAHKASSLSLKVALAIVRCVKSAPLEMLAYVGTKL